MRFSQTKKKESFNKDEAKFWKTRKWIRICLYFRCAVPLQRISTNDCEIEFYEQLIAAKPVKTFRR